MAKAIRASKLVPGDELKIGKKKLVVTDVSPGYCDHTKVSITLRDPKDDIIHSALLVPRHYKL